MKQMINNLQRLKEMEQPEECDFVLDSIVAGHTPGQVFVDDLEAPTISIIWEGHSFIFGGQLSDQLKNVVDFWQHTLLTVEQREKLEFIKLYSPDQVWEEQLMELITDFKHKPIQRVLFRHDFTNLPDLTPSDPNVQIKEIDQQMLTSKRPNIQGLVHEIHYMWGDSQSFLNQGFGVCALYNQEIAGWCTGEYFSKMYCGLGIETVETYQKQGIGTLMALAAVRNAQDLGLIPHWDSWKNNIPSVRVAENVGFKKIKEYNVIGVLLVDE